MNPFYAEMCEGLRALNTLEKTAADVDAGAYPLVRLTQSQGADELFKRTVKLASERYEGDVALQAAQLARSLRDTHRAVSGTKVAHDEGHADDLIVKFAAAVYVDQVLEGQLYKLADNDAWVQTRSAQLLGREYAMHVMGALLA